MQKVLFMHRQQGIKGLSVCGLVLKRFDLIGYFFSEITKISLFKPHLSSHQECLLFCFLPIIQAELNEVIEITIPQSAEEALDLYVSLLRCLSSDSFEVSE